MPPPLLPDETRCLLRHSALLLLTNPDAAGWLDRRSNISGWYRYWFSLRGSQLLYFDRVHSSRRGLLVGTISLFGSKISVVNTLKRRGEFEVCEAAGGKVHILRAASDVQLHQWVYLMTHARKKIPPAKPIQSATLPTSPNGKKLKEPVVVVQSHLKVDHLLCVVHGIGVSEDDLEANMKLLKESYEQVMEKVYPDVEFRIDIVKIFWRAALTALDIHSKLHAVVPVAPGEDDPQNAGPLRQFMVQRIVDYVYYTHDRYRRHILREVAKQLNEQVRQFKERHPEFDGKISVMGHSLGAALCYDLLCRKKFDDQVLLEAEGMRLEFDTENLFCLGSPLGTFLALDPTIGLGRDLKQVPFRIFNVFKYHDPIATRLEPYLGIQGAPVTVPSWFNMGLRESTTQWLGGLLGKKEEGDKSPRGIRSVEDGLESLGNWEWDGGGRRVDYALQMSSTMEEVSTSWSSFKAHNEYWGSRDVMLMMVTVMMKTAFGVPDFGEAAGEKEVMKRVVDENILKKESVGWEVEVLEEDVKRVVENVVRDVVEGLQACERESEGGWASYLSKNWFSRESSGTTKAN